MLKHRTTIHRSAKGESIVVCHVDGAVVEWEFADQLRNFLDLHKEGDQ